MSSCIDRMILNLLDDRIRRDMHISDTQMSLLIGPTAVALLTDYVFRDDLAVPYSVAITIVVAALGAAALFRLGFQPYQRSVEYASRWSDAAPGAARSTGGPSVSGQTASCKERQCPSD